MGGFTTGDLSCFLGESGGKRRRGEDDELQLVTGMVSTIIRKVAGLHKMVEAYSNTKKEIKTSVTGNVRNCRPAGDSQIGRIK